jgi:hypothetical protein
VTPFARKIIERAILVDGLSSEDAVIQTKSINALLSATCLEVSSIETLICETGKTIANNQTKKFFSNNMDTETPCEHGGLLIAPSKFTWIEIKRDNHYLGILVHDIEDQLCTIGFADEIQSPGIIEKQVDDKFVLRRELKHSYTANEDLLFQKTTLFAAAALITINAPYGIEKTKVAAHKGFAKNLVRKGFAKPKPYTIISLSKSAPAHLTGAGTGHHKAFHFVRSHLRHYNNGLTSKVKAHWRGDPALGILKTDYKVIH